MDGALRAEDIWQIAQEHGITLPNLPEQTPAALQQYYQLPKGADFRTAEGFNHFLGMFKIALAVMQTRATLREAACAHVLDLNRQGVVYAETRFAPAYHREGGLSLESIIQAVLEGLKLGHDKSGDRDLDRTCVRPIICIGRECDQETSLAVAKAAIACQNDGVVGLDLACNEVAFPPELHKPAFDLAHQKSLPCTVHAGELAETPKQRVRNISTAINALGAQGLGHAVPLGEDQALTTQVASRKIRVESCPLSNQITGAIGNLKELALDALLENGVRVTLNSDDPAIFGTSLADVFRATCEAYGFGINEVRQLTFHAVEGAFCSAEEKSGLYYKFKRRRFNLISHEPRDPMSQHG